MRYSSSYLKNPWHRSSYILQNQAMNRDSLTTIHPVLKNITTPTMFIRHEVNTPGKRKAFFYSNANSLINTDSSVGGPWKASSAPGVFCTVV